MSLFWLFVLTFSCAAMAAIFGPTYDGTPTREFALKGAMVGLFLALFVSVASRTRNRQK